MCRLLWVRSERPFQISSHLERFAIVARESTEYQGHGWGCAWLDANGWKVHRDIRPIWEDDFTPFPDTTLLLAHARSAFRDEGIRVENNMPFVDGQRAFIFNGELRGVRLRETGRIGAEKIFNFIRRFDHYGRLPSVQKGVDVIEKRTRYLRAMNLIIARPDSSELATVYNENPAYFQMHCCQKDNESIVCSAPYPGETDWQPISNRTIQSL